MTGTADRARARKATGPDRPAYLNTGDIDRVMAILLALVSEVAAVRERLDTHERIADMGTLPGKAGIEAYRASPVDEAEREVWRDAYIKRLFRVITEDIEALADKPESAGDRQS